MAPMSPTRASAQGFMPLSDNGLNMHHETDIPLTSVRKSSSTVRSASQRYVPNDAKMPATVQYNEKSGIAGRRKLVAPNSQRRRVGTDEVLLTGMGKIYRKIVNFSIVTRYFVYVFPIGALLAAPIAIGATVARDVQVAAGVRMFYLFLWLEIVWLSIWISKLVAKVLPTIFIFLCGVVSSGTRKYALVIKNLEIPLSLVGWSITILTTFNVLVNNNSSDQGNENSWPRVMMRILPAIMITTIIYFAEKLIIQLISISYHQRSFNLRIKESKKNVHMLGLLYETSRSLFPMYCPEFEDEDMLINDSIEAVLSNSMGKIHHHRAGSIAPMRLIGDIGRFGDKITSAFGNIASEISGKEVFNPTSAHSIVVEALEKTRSSEALARRIWMSFVVEGKSALYLQDIEEVLGSSRREEAHEAFYAIDNDSNGDISLDEMVMKVVEISRERKAIANSMKDISQAISSLDQVLSFVVLIIVVFVFVTFLNTSFYTTIAAAGAGLLSLSFMFAVTTQEFLGSCIFLFVKHPYDVGDRVDITGPEKLILVVEQISLLYTVFKRVDCMKVVQVPNIVLNTLWIENISRSKSMKEQLELFISFDTPLEDIEALREEMEAFVRHSDNSRDFQPDIILECTGIASMDKLQLKIEIRHKSNWANETVRASRRSKFMCALVLALRKVPIYCPGGGYLPLGDPGNPSYAVSVTDQVATSARTEAAKAKEANRLVRKKSNKPKSSSGAGKSSGNDASQTPLGTKAEVKASEALNSRRPTVGSRQDSSESVGNLVDGKTLLNREPTRGRRKPGETAPLPKGDEESLFAIHQDSKARASFDEEANAGLMTPVESNFGGAALAGSHPKSIPLPVGPIVQSAEDQRHLSPIQR